MAGEFFGGPLSITGTAQNLTTLLGLPERKWFCELSIRALDTNVDKIWVGRSNVTTVANQLGYIRAAEAIDTSLSNAFVNTDDLYLVGTPGDVAYAVALA